MARSGMVSNGHSKTSEMSVVCGSHELKALCGVDSIEIESMQVLVSLYLRPPRYLAIICCKRRSMPDSFNRRPVVALEHIVAPVYEG